ncbi:MAG: hypothetical protein GTO53_13360 [Planctomycetales bacterium]|nr:hypothetical protein [Planctomycetales bacterium]NIM10083.1 hypothetical protein [Planctomycetales bacterium]NIN09526.1 hypothetical protein [Planctomycetales bacterium]NIN78636.1 hypothetical protein [Planctomycetales bacterium]NIO35830.1 hypothetical protein [Planctomycetales bacterium]
MAITLVTACYFAVAAGYLFISGSNPLDPNLLQTLCSATISLCLTRKMARVEIKPTNPPPILDSKRLMRSGKDLATAPQVTCQKSG